MSFLRYVGSLEIKIKVKLKPKLHEDENVIWKFFFKPNP